MDLKDKVAVVTGASAGIGAATVKALLNVGMKVVGFARRREKIENLVQDHDGKLFAVSVDITKPEEVVDGFAWVTKHVGPVHVLINNAGVASPACVITGDIEAWRKVMDTNLMGVAIACKEGIKVMKEHNVAYGYIINVGSVMGYYDWGSAAMMMYKTSKTAQRTLTETIRIELARMDSQIRITSVAPGLVKTEIFEASGFSREMTESIFEKLPYLLGEDVANTIIYLLSTPPHVHITELLMRPTGEYGMRYAEVASRKN